MIRRLFTASAASDGLANLWITPNSDSTLTLNLGSTARDSPKYDKGSAFEAPSLSRGQAARRFTGQSAQPGISPSSADSHRLGGPVKSGHIARGISKMKTDRTNRKRALLNDEVIWEIRRRLANGEFQHDIAADLSINQGRISEVKTGKRRPSNDNWAS